MKTYLLPFITALMDSYSVPIIGLTYIVIKLLIKHLIHKAIDHEFDFWDVMAWFSVDVTLLSISVSIATDVPAKLNMRGPVITYFYIIFIVFCALNSFCYLFFTKRRDNLQKIRPYKDWKLAALLSISWLIGFAWFWGTLDALKS
jgi:hypothetical protein